MVMTANSMGVSLLLNVLCCEMSSWIRHNNGWIAVTVDKAPCESTDGVANSITGKGGKSVVLQGHPYSLAAGYLCVLPTYCADLTVNEV